MGQRRQKLNFTIPDNSKIQNSQFRKFYTQLSPFRLNVVSFFFNMSSKQGHSNLEYLCYTLSFTLLLIQKKNQVEFVEFAVIKHENSLTIVNGFRSWILWHAKCFFGCYLKVRPSSFQISDQVL